MYRGTRETEVKMKQQTLAMAADQGDGYEPHRKLTKRDTFLATMEQIVPWQELCSVIDWAGTHAADVLRAALVQPGRRSL